MSKDVPFDTLVGLTMTEVANLDNEVILFVSAEGRTFRLYHEQDCCESVRVDDIVGELDFLVGAPILKADEASGDSPAPAGAESFTWTFYHLATIKGYVTLRWLGESNGCYSESVTFVED